MHHDESNIEAEVQAAISGFFAAWMQPLDEALAATLAYIPDDFAGIGTGPGDYYDDRAAFAALLRREKEQELATLRFEMPRLTIRVLQSTVALVDGQIRSEVHTEAQTHVVRPRFSMVLEKRAGRWLIIHMHFSVPDEMQEQGDTLRDALERRNRVLEQEVKQRTAQLEQSLADLQAMQTQLIQQEKLASLGRLTAGIAHEMKNPLNFVNNFATLSVDLTEDLAEALGRGESAADLLGDLRQNAEAIARHGQRADRIVRNMMGHARSGSGQRVATDLNALVREHLDLAYHVKQAAEPAFSATVERNLSADVGMVSVVPRDIGQVVLNLVGNAFDAVDGLDAPHVMVSTQRRNGQAELRVADNGPGIPEALRDKVFEPFFTTKPTGQGTGLGLSLSYDIITQGHGGTMAVEHSEGQGAVFVITIPA